MGLHRRRAAALGPQSLDKTRADQDYVEAEPDWNQGLRNKQRNLRHLAALIELGQHLNHGPAGNDDDHADDDDREIGKDIEHLTQFRWQGVEQDVHADLLAFEADHAVAEKYGADEQKQHHLLGRRDRLEEHIATDDVGEIERDGDEERDGRQDED